MIGEPDAGNPPVRFDEGRQENRAFARRACLLLYRVPKSKSDPFLSFQGGCQESHLASISLAGFLVIPYGRIGVIPEASPPSGWAEDFHLQTAEHAQHTTKPLARRTLRVWCSSGFVQTRLREATAIAPYRSTSEKLPGTNPARTLHFCGLPTFGRVDTWPNYQKLDLTPGTAIIDHGNQFHPRRISFHCPYQRTGASVSCARYAARKPTSDSRCQRNL